MWQNWPGESQRILLIPYLAKNNHYMARNLYGKQPNSNIAITQFLKNPKCQKLPKMSNVVFSP